MKKKSSSQGSLAAMFSNVGKVLEIEISKISKNPKQPRFEAHNSDIEELAHSIDMHGLLQPVVVCENGDGYTLIGGERRILAAKFLNKTKIEAFVFASGLKNEKFGILALVENLDRKRLHPIEVGFAFEELLNTDAFTSQRELAVAFSYSDATISKYLSAIRLPRFVIDAIKMADYRDLEVICALNLLESDDALGAFSTIAGDGLSREDALKLIRDIKAKNIPKIEPFVLKERNGIYRFKINSKVLSVERQELLKQKLVEIEQLFS